MLVQLFERADRALRAASGTLALVASLLILGLILLTATDVTFRVIRGASIPGAFEMSEMTLVASVFLAIPYTMRVSGHVAIDSLTTRLPPTAAKAAVVAGLLAVVPVIAWWFVRASMVAATALRTGETRMGIVAIPVWPVRVAIATGAGLLVLEMLSSTVREIIGSEGASHADLDQSSGSSPM